MKTTTLALLLTLTNCTSSCGGTSPHVSWPSVVGCADVVRDDLLATVQAVLVDHAPGQGDNTRISERATRSFESLAAEHGPSVVACLIDQAVHSFDRAAVVAEPAPVPAEPPAKSRDFNPGAVPAPTVPPEPTVQTVPEPTTEQLAAARGRDFLQRVAQTHVEGADQ